MSQFSSDHCNVCAMEGKARRGQGRPGDEETLILSFFLSFFFQFLGSSTARSGFKLNIEGNGRP